MKLSHRLFKGAGPVLSAIALACGLPMSQAQAQSPLAPQAVDVYAPPAGWQSLPHGQRVHISPVGNSPTANALLQAFEGKAGYTKPLRAWRVAYTTTGADPDLVATRPGAPLLATGIVIVPVGVPSPQAKRPIVIFAPKTQGIGANCAPSKALELGREETSEVKRMVAALDKGYVVAITDYDGYTYNSQAHQYLVGHTLGHAVLDMALVTRDTMSYLDAFDTLDAQGNKQMALSASAPMVIWGYSEGGTAAAWAGQLLPTYAPSLMGQIKGVATGGPVVDFKLAAKTLDSNLASGLLLAAVWGYHVAYPKPYENGGLYFALNSTYKQDLLGWNYNYKYAQNPPKTDSANAILHPDECVDQLLADHTLKTMRWRNADLLGITDLTSLPHLRWDATLRANDVGNMRIDVPVLYYFGTIATSLNSNGTVKDGDGILPSANFESGYTRMCTAGTKVARQVLVSSYYLEAGHQYASDMAFPHVTAWMDDRFNNRTFVPSCN